MDTRAHTIRERLIEVAKRKETIFYKEVGGIVDLHHRDPNLHQILDDINRREHEARRPLLTAVVVHATGDRMPGKGFFKLATQLGRHRAADDRTLYWMWELERVYTEWASA